MNTSIQNRIIDLANRSYERNIYTNTNFLTLADLSEFNQIVNDIKHIPYTLFGGYDDSERVIIRFGSVDSNGYEEPYPIDILEISPLIDKFSDELTHRDFLGALMNLGIERDVIGDILIDNNRAYIFVLNSISEYIIESLTRVKHTSVMIKIIEALPDISGREHTFLTIQIPSERIDVIISKVYHLSRDNSISLFREGRVFINSILCENNSKIVKNNERITVRGFGKFIYLGQSSVSKKLPVKSKV